MGGAKGEMMTQMVEASNKSPEDKARARSYFSDVGGAPQPLPYAPVTALEQTSRRRNAGTILTGPTRAGDKKALLGQ